MEYRNQQITATVAIDLSTTFDTVDHQILTDVLNKRFNIEGVALDWFSNYLSSRSCKWKMYTQLKNHHFQFLKAVWQVQFCIMHIHLHCKM